MNWLHVIFPWLGAVSVVRAGSSVLRAALAKRVLRREFVPAAEVALVRLLLDELQLEEHPNFRRRHTSLFRHPDEKDRRQNKQDFTEDENCDEALLTCLPEDRCAACFRYLYSKDISWTGITPDTQCADVMEYLAKKNYCADMHEDETSMLAFCKSFEACAVWEEEDDDDEMDCSSLTSCEWEGMHKAFIGDGSCQANVQGCYNTAICDWDGGDCCEDTCQPNARVSCGVDGYVCKDTNSVDCDPRYTLGCPSETNVRTENYPNPSETMCGETETKYRLNMFDTFGDGWDQTTIEIFPTPDKKDIAYVGGLETGSTGTRYVCLPTSSTCIHVDVSGGEWGNEVSWEIRPMSPGAPALSAGGSPMSCDFAVGGSACESTCTGKANLKPNTDPEYKEFKEMYTCIEEKCTIQVGVCESDDTCSTCLSDEKADFCYGSDAFLAVVDCTMCQCTERKGTAYCHSKLGPGVPVPSLNSQKQPDGSPRACSPSETMKGSDAVLAFAECTAFDQVTMLVTNYDENNFGLLDQFETCSHSFNGEANHGGHTALGCIRILVTAMEQGDGSNTEEDKRPDAVSVLAGLLYFRGEEFCECASRASADCPLCSSFIHLKTLLYESLDACLSLDQIDCEAWAEFHDLCKSNFVEAFGSADFTSEAACEFVHEGCGGVGPFPAFRKLDCDGEISRLAWDFYREYAENCLGDADEGYLHKPVNGRTDGPAGAPLSKRPTKFNALPATLGPTPTPRPTRPYNPQKYVTSDDDIAQESPATSTTKSRGLAKLFIICLLGWAGYYYFRRRSDGFSLVRYRNNRNYECGEREMYSSPYNGFVMNSGSGVFIPPSLPPTLSGIDGTSN